MSRENLGVRQMARKAGIPLWRVAINLGISEPTLTRWMRVPLPSDKEQRIVQVIQELSGEVAG